MKNSIEEDIKNAEHFINSIKTDKEYKEENGWHGYYNKEIVELARMLEHILSAYKRVLKENEELLELKVSASAHNRILELEKENKNLKATNKDLQKSVDMIYADYQDIGNKAFEYSDKIEQLQKENEELKADNLEYQRIQDLSDKRTYRKKYLEERRKEEPNLLYPDSDEIYQRYYELKEQFANSIPISKLKEEVLNPMKEGHDKAIKGFISTDAPECGIYSTIAQELGYFIGKIEELIDEEGNK